jgi:murein DD-endopeptidase MepM/ murein hydrolase activator NlpD
MVHPTQHRPPAGKPQPSAIVFAHKGKIRTFRVRPGWLALAAGSFVALVTAYSAAAAYLVFRDDLFGAALRRQVEMQFAYEDRIAALRAELDRVTSRHAVETLGVEEQLALLLSRQELIAERQSALDGLVARAGGSGVAVAAARLPRARPAAPPDGNVAAPAALAYSPAEPATDIITGALIAADAAPATPRSALLEVGDALDRVEAGQEEALDSLSAAAAEEAGRVEELLEPLDLGAEAAAPKGGPLIAAGELHFVEKAALLGRTLDAIGRLKAAAASGPLMSPLPAAPQSSAFGYRIDPFLHRPAFHGGLDFVAVSGAAVQATAPGVVVTAGWSGGYGNLVEIRHAGGVSTRYGHLSAVLVREGEHVEAGDAIGAVGSTGRSTGPHLHYETRRDGEPVDPSPFLAAGRGLWERR